MQKIAIVHGTGFDKGEKLLNGRIERAYELFEEKKVDTIVCAGGIPGTNYEINAEVAADILSERYFIKVHNILIIGGKHFIGEYRALHNKTTEMHLKEINAPMENVFGRISRLKKSYTIASADIENAPTHISHIIEPEIKIFITRVKEAAYEVAANGILYLPYGESIMDRMRRDTQEQT